MKPLVALLALCLLAAAVSCRRGDQAAGPFVTAPGSFEFFGGELSVNITQNTNGAVNYRIKHGPSVSGPSRPPFRAGQPWFIYPQSPTNAWIFDGRTNIALLEFHLTGTKMTTSQREPELWKTVPQAVRDRLPAGLK